MKTKSVSLPPSPPKVSFFGQVKQFINEKLEKELSDDEGICNEATHVVFRNKQKAPPVKEVHKVNLTQPIPQQKFEIGNDQKNELSERVFDIDEEEEDKKPNVGLQSKFEELDGYKIIDIKQMEQQVSILLKPIEPYTKKQTIQFPPQSAFRATKSSKKYSSLIDYFKKDIERYIAIDGGWFYMLEKKGHDVFRVKSVTPLDRLKKIFLKQNQKQPHIRLAFIRDNDEYKFKCFTLKDYETLFFLKMKNEIQKYGLTF